MTLKDVIILWVSITPIVQQWEQTISPKHPGQPQPPALIYDDEDEET